jgi:hypothetical protein
LLCRKAKEPWQKFNGDVPIITLVTHGPTLMEKIKVHVSLGKKKARFGLACLQQVSQSLTTAATSRRGLTVEFHSAASTSIAIPNSLCLRSRHHKQPWPPAATYSHSSTSHLLPLSMTSNCWQPRCYLTSYRPMLGSRYDLEGLQYLKQVGPSISAWFDRVGIRPNPFELVGV